MGTAANITTAVPRTMIAGERCANSADVPMTEAHDIVIEALLDDVLDKSIVDDAVNEALRLLQGDGLPIGAAVERELAKVEQERTRLVNAIATGGQLDGLLEALQARERDGRPFEAERELGERPI